MRPQTLDRAALDTEAPEQPTGFGSDSMKASRAGAVRKLFMFWGAALFAIAAVLQAALFMSGYRLTADDVLYDYIAMLGWDDAWRAIAAHSALQGRITHFVDVPLSYAAAWLADDTWFRAAYTGLHFANFVLFGVYVSVLLRARLWLLVAVLLVALQPLDFFHLPPNAYPTHVSVPVFLILLARLRTMALRRRTATAPSLRFELPWLALCLAGMFVSEGAFIFGTVLMAAEALAPVWSGERPRISTRAVLRDAALVAIFLLVYVAYRAANPSHYSGNSVDMLRPDYFLRTLTGHIYGSTAFAAYSRHAEMFVLTLGTLSRGNLAAIAAVFICTLGAAYVSLRALRGAPVATRALVLGLATGGVLAVLSSAPVAAITRYQDWCEHLDACIFHDSRMSFFGVGLALACSLALLMGVLGREWLAKAVTAAGALTIATLAAATFVTNLGMSREMRAYTEPWRRARQLACVPAAQSAAVAPVEIVDPLARVSTHDPAVFRGVADIRFDRADYWKRVVEKNRQRGACAHALSLTDLYPPIARAARMSAGAAGGASPFLESGWSVAEPWGTWSDGTAARILLPLRFEPQRLQLEVQPFVTSAMRTQRVEVWLNGRHVQDVVLEAGKTSLEVGVAPGTAAVLDATGRLLQLELRIPDATSPLQAGIGADPRRLGLGLFAFTAW